MAVFTGKLISKQAVAKRLSAHAVKFLKLVLKAVIAYPLKIDTQQLDQILLQFKHVWLADSTSIKLDSSLVDIFPGSRNQTQKQSAILKIQLCLRHPIGYSWRNLYFSLHAQRPESFP